MPGLWFDEVGDQRPAGAEIPPLYLEYQPGCADHATESSALRNCWLAGAGARNALRARCSEAAAIWIVVAATSVAPRTVIIVFRIVRLPKCSRSVARSSARCLCGVHWRYGLTMTIVTSGRSRSGEQDYWSKDFSARYWAGKTRRAQTGETGSHALNVFAGIEMIRCKKAPASSGALFRWDWRSATALSAVV
jgi:hypothetical protein